MLRLALILATALLAGCGGGGRDEATQRAEAWLRAIGERDAEQACALMRESAVKVIGKRSGLDPDTPCLSVVREYSDAFEPGDIDGILKIGLEAEGRVKDNEIGVFPRTGARQFQVILMRRSGDAWKVATTSLGPSRPVEE